ncbi:hypothetical protein NLB33_33390 [Mycolicibacterium smegmatis]|uniref:hypothetical protein n=1 Tax=Mycolicibacterium smegmatis TaxID=1772 RepID=UPI0020A539DA|nr:hypothetical protein [Mycolicibacterium smegmatis]MCP2627744.1 hypothetical protein [Mycolicibacterium smegmatis]
MVTVLVVRPDDGDSTANGGPEDTKSEFASVIDKGPVEIITEDPTCDAWNNIAGQYSQAADAVNWEDRDFNIPASSWTPEQRSMYEAVGKAMTQAIDNSAKLAVETPHRVMRVLYEQFIAYTRAFIDRLPSYVAEDDNFVAASNGAGGSISNICGAIAYRSAQSIAPMVPPASDPIEVVAPQDPKAPTPFITEPNTACDDWLSLATKFSDDTAAWRETNKSVSAAEWDPTQRSINEAVGPIMSTNAEEMERLGERSNNGAFDDIASLAAQYRRGFVAALPNYKAADSYLELTATNLVRLINWACQAPL